MDVGRRHHLALPKAADVPFYDPTLWADDCFYLSRLERDAHSWRRSAVGAASADSGAGTGGSVPADPSASSAVAAAASIGEVLRAVDGLRDLTQPHLRHQRVEQSLRSARLAAAAAPGVHVRVQRPSWLVRLACAVWGWALPRLFFGVLAGATPPPHPRAAELAELTAKLPMLSDADVVAGMNQAVARGDPELAAAFAKELARRKLPVGVARNSNEGGDVGANSTHDERGNLYRGGGARHGGTNPMLDARRR